MIKHELDKQKKGLTVVLDDYMQWFMQVVRNVFYQKAQEEQKNLLVPESFVALLEDMQRSDIKSAAIEGLNKLHKEMIVQADKLIGNSVKLQTHPTYEEFDAFVILFEEFIYHIRRMEIDCLLEDNGIDVLTGLRSQAVLEQDLKREMARLARQGKPFSIALVRIDNFDEMKKNYNVDDLIKLVAEMIKKSLRSFDYAYRLEHGKFMFSLKQTNISGGIRALERLKEELQSQKKSEGKVMRLSLSSCVAEPVSGDDVRELIENLHKDLDSSEKQKGGSVLEYFEMSPLQRYVKDEQG